MKAQQIKNIYQCVHGCCDIMVQSYSFDYKVYDYKNKIKRNKAGVFFHDPIEKKILLVQSRGEKWGPPKGTLEGDETYEEGAIREVREETGIVLTKEQLDKCEKHRIDRSYYYYFEIQSDQLETVDNTNVSGNDASGMTWIDIECLKKMNEMGFIDLNSHCKKLLYKLFKVKIV